MTTLLDTINEIDPIFPVPGKDNNSQGFHDVFTKIKNSLLEAEAQIIALQTQLSQVVNNADSYNSLTKTFNGRASYSDIGQDTDVDMDLINDGHDYFRYKVAPGFNTIKISNWPLDSNGDRIYLKVRVELISTGVPMSIAIDMDPKFLKLDSSFTDIVNPSIEVSNVAGTSFVYDFWTYNNGNTVYISKVGEFRSAS